MSEKVVAEVIEPHTLSITKAVPGSTVESNIESVAIYVKQQIAMYQTYDIKTEEEYKQAKRERSAVRSMISGIEEERKRVKKLYLEPLEDFEAKVKDVISPARELDAGMKETISAYERRWQEIRRSDIRRHYEDYAPLIALPLEDMGRALVPFECIEDKKWYLRSESEISAFEDVESICHKIARSESRLKGLGLKHESEALACFYETLDFEKAVARDKEISDSELRQLALEKERKSLEAQAEACEKPVKEETPSEQEDEVLAYTIHARMTKNQCEDLISLLVSMGIKGEVYLDAR